MERDLLRSFLSVFGTKIGALLIGIITTPLIVRLLGSGRYGDYALVISVFAVLTVITNSGIFNGLRKYIAEDRAIADWTDSIFSFYFRVSLLVSVILTLTLVAVSRTSVLVDLLASEFQIYFTFLALYLFVSQFYSIGRGVLMGFGLEHYSEPLQLIEKIVFAVSAIALLYIGLGVSGVLAGHIISILLVGVIALWLIRDRVSFRKLETSTPDVVSRYDLLTFNVYSILLAFLTISLYNVDILLLRPMVGSSETGYYKAALVVAGFLWIAPIAIQYTLVQSTSKLWSNDKREQISDIATTSTRLNLFLMVIMIIGLAALADVFIPVYFGEEFSPAVGPLLLLLPGVVGLALARPIFAIGQGKGELQALVLTTGVAAVLNLILNLLLIPRYGMYGAATATSVGYGSMFLFHTYTARKIGFNPVRDIRIPRILLAGTVTAPVVFGLAFILPGLVALVVVPPIGFIVYATVSFQIGVIDRVEIEQLQQRSPDTIDSVYALIYRLQR